MPSSVTTLELRCEDDDELYDALGDNDDVQKVYANFDIDESEIE